MAKLTARFDWPDRITSRLRVIRGEMVRINRLRHRTDQRPFVIRVKIRPAKHWEEFICSSFGISASLISLSFL